MLENMYPFELVFISSGYTPSSSSRIPRSYGNSIFSF